MVIDQHDNLKESDNLCDWYNIYDKEQLKADIEDAYHSQEITN